MNNRRNFYRILHVQPEAPLEIIKASYRSLMTKLKAHPDLGGDHETAILINQAYGVLSDPKKRKHYDESLSARKGPTRGFSAHTGFTQTYENTRQRRQSACRPNFDDKQQSASIKKRCLFCGTDAINTQRTDNYCRHCKSPLDRAQSIPNDRLREIFGRRSAPRIAKIGALIIYPTWPHVGFSARLRDLSPSGISLLTHYGARTGQILKFDSSNLKGVAQVVSVRSNGSHFSVHAAFLAAEFVSKAGTFVAEKV